MDANRIAEIRARLKKITPWPWTHINSTQHCGPYVDSFFGDVADCYTLDARNRPVLFQDEKAEPNADFISHSPQDVADLLSAIDTLTREREARELRLINYVHELCAKKIMFPAETVLAAFNAQVKL